MFVHPSKDEDLFSCFLIDIEQVIFSVHTFERSISSTQHLFGHFLGFFFLRSIGIWLNMLFSSIDSFLVQYEPVHCLFCVDTHFIMSYSIVLFLGRSIYSFLFPSCYIKYRLSMLLHCFCINVQVLQSYVSAGNIHKLKNSLFKQVGMLLLRKCMYKVLHKFQ